MRRQQVAGTVSLGPFIYMGTAPASMRSITMAALGRSDTLVGFAAPCQLQLPHRHDLQTPKPDQLEQELQQGRRDAEHVAHTEYSRLVGRLGSEHPHLNVATVRLEQLDQDFA